MLCGLANSVMYPTIFALGIAELGPMTSKGSGVITIGNVGGAVVPLLFGMHWPTKWGFNMRLCCRSSATSTSPIYGLLGYKPTRTAAA